MWLLSYETVALTLLIRILTKQSRFEAHALTFAQEDLKVLFTGIRNFIPVMRKAFPKQN